MPRSDSWRHNHETRERMLRVYGLHVRGLTHAVIAARLRVSERTVARDLDHLHTFWQDQRRDFLDRERLRCLGSLREIDRLLWTKLDAHKADENPTNLTRLLRVFLNGQREARRRRAAARSPTAAGGALQRPRPLRRVHRRRARRRPLRSRSDRSTTDG